MKMFIRPDSMVNTSYGMKHSFYSKPLVYNYMLRVVTSHKFTEIKVQGIEPLYL